MSLFFVRLLPLLTRTDINDILAAMETQDAVIIKTIIDMMKSAKEDNLDLAITDEIILEAENALRKGLTKWTFNLEALKSATEGSDLIKAGLYHVFIVLTLSLRY
jgi:hypothetical protein